MLGSDQFGAAATQPSHLDPCGWPSWYKPLVALPEATRTLDMVAESLKKTSLDLWAASALLNRLKRAWPKPFAVLQQDPTHAKLGYMYLVRSNKLLTTLCVARLLRAQLAAAKATTVVLLPATIVRHHHTLRTSHTYLASTQAADGLQACLTFRANALQEPQSDCLRA